jgi:hypothetical protein
VAAAVMRLVLPACGSPTTHTRTGLAGMSLSAAMVSPGEPDAWAACAMAALDEGTVSKTDP